MITPDFTRVDAGLPPHPRPHQLQAVRHQRAEIHHSGVADHFNRDPRVLLNGINRDHTSRGWNGGFYNVMIDTNGRVWELRGIGSRSIGQHSPRYRDGTVVNPGNLTVLLPGNYTVNRMSRPMQETLRRLLITMPNKTPAWHSLRDASDCPGASVVSWLVAFDTTIPPRSDMILNIGSRGEEVQYLQRVLIFWHFLAPGQDDGIYGPATGNAARAFKAEMRKSSRNPGRLGDTVAWGPRTYEELGAFTERVGRL